jgi:hypothetical protein
LAPHALTCCMTSSMVIPACLLDTKEEADIEIFEMCSWITSDVLSYVSWWASVKSHGPFS